MAKETQNGVLSTADESASYGENEQKAPNGGTQAWLVVLGAFISMFCTQGYIGSFGIFQSYYTTHFLQHEAPSNISWIGSLQVFLISFGGVFAGPLADRFGSKAVLIPASLILVLSVMLTSFCNRYYHFILAQGILPGLACGMILTPVLSAAGQYFTTRRAWAMGIIVSGASVGGVVFPLALDRLLNRSSLGFGWTIRLMGFIILALLSSACLLVKEHAPRRLEHRLSLEMLKNKPYVFANVGFFLTLLGLWTPVFYIIDYAVAQGMSLEMAFYEVSILNAASILGRTLPCYVGDRMGRYNMMVFMNASSGVLLLCWTLAQSTMSITVFIWLYGFFSGAVNSLYAPCIAQICPKSSDIGTYLGMGFCFCSFAGLAGTPICGALVKKSGYYLYASIFSGSMVLAGAGSNLVARLYLSREFRVVI